MIGTLDSFKNLASRSSICAMVVGKGQEFRLFYLHEDGVDEEIRAAAEQGYLSCGLIGLLANGRLEMQSEPDASESLMLFARAEFLTALTLMHVGGSVN
jgi:hypothetical protein